jgi:26S proteasome regulatory subunit N10
MAAISGIHIGGDSQFVNAIQVAKLTLKHRANKNQRQRICVLVASPVEESTQKLQVLGRTLKRDNISLNILNLGNNNLTLNIS